MEVARLGADYRLVGVLEDGSDNVIVEKVTGQWFGEVSHHFEISHTIPMVLDTRSGQAHQLTEGAVPEHVRKWIHDPKGRILAAVQEDQGQTILLQPDGPGKWKEVRRFASYAATPESFDIRFVSVDGNAYATHVLPGPAATTGLFRVDPSTWQLDAKPLFDVQGFDFSGSLIEDAKNHRLLGIHYESDATGTAWFDKNMQAVQAKIDAKLPGVINDIGIANCGCSQKMVVTSYSDRQPSRFYVYDAGADTLVAIGSAHPEISPRQMADTDFVRIKARDGSDLPIYVTKPHGKGPWPMIVDVHGGPQVRGWHWRWDAESQLLASRGYLVVKPEYRGSDGYGQTHLMAGFKQWGLASQDDIADATVWAEKQGLADPNRTCIMGASYGGYATLMGLVRYGNLYRCGVAWSAVTDIDLMYDIWQSDLPDEWKAYGMPVMIGDRVKDAAQFAATSPLKQVARIKRPLLLAHGDLDARVPITHATALRDALQANHASLTWIDYPKEGHGWYDPKTSVAWYTEVLKFLDTNIGPNAPAVAANP